MILFYSVFCNHSKMLLEHIKRYDKEKMIKLVSIDDLRNKNINIESKIHSVPAFMILPSKELLFGKAVFDYLLLPGRGILCSTQSTRLDKVISGENDMIPLANTGNGTLGSGSGGSGGTGTASGDSSDSEPLAFTLNTASFSDNFSIIEDETKELSDKNYNWDFITNDNNITDGIKNIPTPVGDDSSGSGGGSNGGSNGGSGGTKSERTSQSLEELKKLRDAQF
jgi:hypothetical protein